MKIERGDIVIADFGQHPDSSLQDGIRPAVVISNNKANRYSPVVTVVPLSTRIYKKRYLPTHVFINRYYMEGLSKNSLALAEQVTSMPVKNIIKKSGYVYPEMMAEITKAIQVQMGMFD